MEHLKALNRQALEIEARIQTWHIKWAFAIEAPTSKSHQGQ